MAAECSVGLQHGDIIQLYCPGEMGYVYSEPGGLNLTIEFCDEPVSKPVGFLCDFSTFCVTFATEDKVKSRQGKIVYGSAVYLQHQASHKYLAVTKDNVTLDENKTSFKIISPNRLGWGKELRNNNEIKLESKGSMIEFSHKNQYHPALAADGTVFSVKVYCQYHNNYYETIKGSSVIILGTCLKIEGFLFANGSFVNGTLKHFHAANNLSYKTRQQIGLLKLVPRSFKRLPCYGDAFFRLEKIGLKVDLHGDSFTYNEHCQIRHLFSLKYISVDESGKINLQDFANDSCKFQILPAHSPLSQKEVFEGDEILFWHVKGKKYLTVNVKPGSNREDTLSSFDLDLNADPSMPKSQFKVSQVTNEALLDAYKAIGYTLSLRKYLIKLLKIAPSKSSLINAQQEDKKVALKGFCQLCSCLESQKSKKERLVNMLQFLKAFDIIAALLEILIQDLDNFQECRDSIFSFLTVCVNNGTLSSAFSLVEGTIAARVLLTIVTAKGMVKKIGAEKLLIALYKKNIDLMSTLDFDQVEDSDLLFTLAFKRRINWHIQKKICEKELKKSSIATVPDEVKEILDIFVQAVCSLQETGIASRSSRMFYPDQTLIESVSFYRQQRPDTAAMKSLHTLLSDNKEKGDIITLLLNVLVFYVDYETYSELEADELIKVLLDLLENSGDFEHKIASSIKILVLLCLRLLFKRHISESIRLSLDLIRGMFLGTQDAPEQTSYSLEEPHQPPQDVALSIEDISATTETSFTNNFEKITKLLKKELNKLGIVSGENNHEKACKILLELIIDEKDEDIRLMSIELLFEIHNAERTLLSEAINSCLDTEYTINYDEMRQLADGKQLLSKLTSRTIDKKLQETFCKNFDELSKSCKSDLVYRCGLFDDVLEFVLESADLQVHDKSNEIEILESCFKLLRSVTRRNKEAQDKIFIYWPSLLKMNPIGPVILLINEVFYNNPDLCNKLTVLDIESIFLTAIFSGTTEHYQLSVVLKAIIKNSNPSVVVKDLIACLILEHSADTLKFKLGSPSRLLDSESDGNDPLLLCITELLVSCTEDGECQYAKSVACQILHPVELFVAIKNNELKTKQRLIFCQLYKAVCHEEFFLATGRLVDTDIEKFRETLKELEEESTTLLTSDVDVQNQDKQNQVRLLRNYISDPPEKIEDAISKKGTFNDFFAKKFRPEEIELCEVFKLLSTLIKERSYYHCCFEKLKLEGMILKTLQFLTAKFNNDGNLKRNYIEMLFHSDEVSLFDLLNHQNFEIICEVLVCLNFCGKDEGFQTKIIKLVTKHDYSLIIRIHQLLRQVEFVFNKAKINPTTNMSQQERRLEAVLDVISLLCDRQQKEMQDAMRENKSFYGSGIVCQVALLLSDTANSMIEKQQVAIAQKSAQALIEMCTGNYKNQEIAFKSQVIVSINVILKSLNENNQCELSSINLKSSCIELLEIMLEEIDENSPQLASWIANYLEKEHLLKVMQQSFERLTLETGDEEKLKSHTLLFRAYHVPKRIKDYKINFFDDSDKKEEDDAMWSYCEHRSRSIEIIYEPEEGKEILSRAYFPYHPGLHHVKDKKSILLHIKRSTPQEKLLDLLKWAKAVKRTNKQKNKYWCVHETLLRSAPARHYILLLLTYILNLLILIIKTPPDYNMQVTNNEFCTKNDTVGAYNETCNSTKNAIYFQPIWNPEIPFWSSITMSILGIIHAVLAILMVIDYFYRNWRPRCGTIYLCRNLWYNFAKWLLRKDCTYRCLSKCLSHKPKETQPNEYFQIFFESFQPFYRITFMVCSVLAWIPYPASLRYLYCICMIYPFLRIDVMQYILKAVKRSFIQLAIVFLLCFVLMYIYAVISFAFLNNYMSKEKDQFCDNILQCFFTVSRLGLLDTLGSEFNIRPSDEYEPNFTLYALRTVYDIIFFIVITTLALNIIIAILVDRFSRMRQTQDTVDEDDASKCFICSIERSEFDKRNKDFKKHVNEEHNMWNYIRYIIYLKNLPENDHNAVEKHVSNKICDDSNKPQSEGQKPCDFFPLFRAKALPDYKPSEIDSEEKLHQLITKTKELEKALHQVKKEVEKASDQVKKEVEKASDQVKEEVRKALDQGKNE